MSGSELEAGKVRFLLRSGQGIIPAVLFKCFFYTAFPSFPGSYSSALMIRRQERIHLLN
jgi:hypothetical protein